MKSYISTGGLFSCAVCVKCQLANSTNAIYCQHCGTKMDATICPNKRCRKANSSDATKCKQCHTSFINNN